MNPQKNSVGRVPCQLPPTVFQNNPFSLALIRLGCSAAILVAALSVEAQDIFMRIGGSATAMGQDQSAPTLAGESTDPQYLNWIPVLSMSQGVSRPVSLGAGGVTSSTPSHSDVNLMKQLDKATPSINLLVNGAPATVSLPIDFVTIDFRKSGTREVFYRIELQGVYVTSAQISATADGGVPAESVSLHYTKIKWSYIQHVGGKAQPAITKGWDIPAGKAL